MSWTLCFATPLPVTPMRPALEAIATELLEALDRVHALAHDVPADTWAVRMHPERWSVAECLAHLNLTSAAMLPAVATAMDEARSRGGPVPARPRHSPLGWLLWRSLGPPVRFRTATTAPFVPQSVAPAGELVAEFERLQEILMTQLRAADGLPIDRVRLASPFNVRVRYNLYSCFAIVARHQHRHLWQAEQVWNQRPS